MLCSYEKTATEKKNKNKNNALLEESQRQLVECRAAESKFLKMEFKPLIRHEAA